MIVFTCPGCGQKLNVKEELAGKQVRCGHCKKMLVIPSPTAATAQRKGPPAAPQAVPPPRPAARPNLLDATVAAPDDTPSTAEAGEAKFNFLSAPQAPDEIGRLGPYRVLKVLGAGGMGMVLQAEDPLL